LITFKVPGAVASMGLIAVGGVALVLVVDAVVVSICAPAIDQMALIMVDLRVLAPHMVLFD
jgi:hypothetical protein